MSICSEQPCSEPTRDFLTVTVGNTVFTVEQIFNGDRSLSDIMGEFLEREIGNLDK